MAATITLQELESLGACDYQRALFAEVFPGGSASFDAVQVKLAVSSGLAVSWLAVHSRAPVDVLRALASVALDPDPDLRYLRGSLLRNPSLDAASRASLESV